jgi:putative glutathione S-transferase
MTMLVEGEWRIEGLRADVEVRFVRSTTTFKDWVTADGSSGFPAEEGRYHLYVP